MEKGKISHKNEGDFESVVNYVPEGLRRFVTVNGLFIPYPVSQEQYNQEYFSDKNIAYKEKGYSERERLEKYADAIKNIQFLTQQNPGFPVLDLGCGPGYLVKFLQEKGISAYGVDITSQVSGKNLVQANITHLPFSNNSFGLVYSFHVLEHLPLSELDKAFDEIDRVVDEKGGMLYLIIPTWDNLPTKELAKQVLQDPTHRTIATREWWINRFSQFNWQINEELTNEFDRLKRGWVFVFNRGVKEK